MGNILSSEPEAMVIDQLAQGDNVLVGVRGSLSSKMLLVDIFRVSS